MSTAALKLAVVGHTNTGKTSLLRTLTRDVDFGDVSARPATTRHVEGTSILLDGRKVMELYDTPGLEDSIGLLDHLDKTGGRRAEGIMACQARANIDAWEVLSPDGKPGDLLVSELVA